MKNYYFTLGLSIYARDSEIKSMYRKLALTYHPDKNPSPEAESIFKEINEAYEVLSDPQRKLLYDQMLVGIEPPVQPASPTHRDPRYRPKPPGFVHQRNSMRERLFDFMSANLNYAIWVSRLALFFSLMMVADFLLNPTKSILEIVDKESIYGGRTSSVKVKMENGQTLTLAGKDANKFKIGNAIAVHYSPILSVPVKLEDEGAHLAARVPVSVYGNFIFMPLALLLTSLAGTFFRKGVEIRFNLGVMNSLLLFFNFIFLRAHNF
ncbi:MAG: DnaJ domain-containing protein [Cyclobacteriaceae bacterium]